VTINRSAKYETNENNTINGAKSKGKIKISSAVRPNDLNTRPNPDHRTRLPHQAIGAAQTEFGPSCTKSVEVKTIMQIHAASSSTPKPILARTRFIAFRTGFVFEYLNISSTSAGFNPDDIPFVGSFVGLQNF
jgi:hypothetical protein